ncbi:hypothetical protein PDN23_14290 [Bacillus cereus]|nr:hypothetical protein [Bacillus cereus]
MSINQNELSWEEQRELEEEKQRLEKLKQERQRLYGIWDGIKRRTSDTESERYGARGIELCKEWQTFEPFYKWSIENGHDESLTLDRINFNGDYSPENCRWANARLQANNKSNNYFIPYKGESVPVVYIHEHFNIPIATLRLLGSINMDFEDAWIILNYNYGRFYGELVNFLHIIMGETPSNNYLTKQMLNATLMIDKILNGEQFKPNYDKQVDFQYLFAYYCKNRTPFDWKDVFPLFETFEIAYHSLKEIDFNMDLPDIDFFSNDTIESVSNKVKLNKNGFVEVSNESLHVHHISFPKEHVPQMRAKPKSVFVYLSQFHSIDDITGIKYNFTGRFNIGNAKQLSDKGVYKNLRNKALKQVTLEDFNKILQKCDNINNKIHGLYYLGDGDNVKEELIDVIQSLSDTNFVKRLVNTSKDKEKIDCYEIY